ncbi:MAG: fibro-slime domain-containing protein [Fibrobacter sp.]|nr:fibro-slime domain-containing protein [Fibrobacter sp.]
MRLIYTFLLFFAVVSQATLTLHLQDPWQGSYIPYLVGGATSYSTSPENMMQAEEDGWYVYTWDKDVQDFSWEDFTVQGCPSTTDCNGGVKWTSGGSEVKFQMTSFFASEIELWIYTTANGYTVSVTPPGSKVVWFKSPWGNKALPQMVFGQDSVVMRFVQDEKSTCGWFYGALSPSMIKANPLLTAHFLRYLTPYMSVPASGEVELSEAFAQNDTIYVDGTGATPVVLTTMGAPGECFDSTRTLHVYHPWRTNSTYKDSAVYISVGANIANNPTEMSNEGDEPLWWHYDFPMSIPLNDWNGCSEWGALVNFYSSNNGGKRFWQDGETRPCISSFFPKGVYEAWLYTKNNGQYEMLYSPLERKVVRLMSPWDNMSPIMLVAGDTIKMGPISKDTCGWYQGVSFKHVDSWDVYFRQAFGYDIYSAIGAGDGDPIQMDSMMALHDTVWVTPYPTLSSAPRFSEVYPERLGICPTMKISALIVDWAGEAYDDSIDVDFGNIYYGNDYTTVTYKDSTGATVSGNTCQAPWHPNGMYTVGMVQDTLVNGNPARVDSSIFPWNECTAAREIEKWFVPVEVARDINGKPYTNGVCRDIDLSLDEEGFWLADISEAHEDGGFFPIDDLEYLDVEKTVKNPKFDWDDQLQTGGKKHNYSFAMKISAQFQYVKGQYFEFRGDDDVWVFINNKLVVDIGGCHGPAEGFVDLDTLNLEEGKEYPFHIFFSERNATGSNFKMRTSINLHTQRTFFPVKKQTGDGKIVYDLQQLLIDESLSCDVTSVGKVDTTMAQSVFVLAGGRLPSEGIMLSTGWNYGGIYINENMAGFTIDTTAFVNTRMLEPGSYVLYCYLESDMTQYEIVPFTVPEYPLPDIAFIDVFTSSEKPTVLEPEGLTLRGDFKNGTASDTLLAHVMYPELVPLKIAVMYSATTPCAEALSTVNVNCVATLNFSSKDRISFMDQNGQKITSITTDSLGYASFYVIGDTAIVDGSFKVAGIGVGNELVWTGIHFKEPPVPFALKGSMYDVNGDGVPDSLVVPFNKAFGEISPDTLAWVFGGSDVHLIAGSDNVKPLIFMDSVVVVYNPEGLRSGVFTGSSDELYQGSMMYHYTYKDDKSVDSVKLSMNTFIMDKVGPIAISAVIENLSENTSLLTITLSESTNGRNIDGALAFEIYRDSVKIMDSIVIASTSVNAKGNVYKLYCQRSIMGVIPLVGDSIRLTPHIISDLGENYAHLNNPKVVISGDTRVELKGPGLVTVSEGEKLWPYAEPIAAMAVPLNATIEDAVELTGLPGLLMPVDLGKVAGSVVANLPVGANVDSALATVRIIWQNYYFSHLGNFVAMTKGEISCNDHSVYGEGNCVENPGNVFFAWNGRSKDGRKVGTGAYISKINVKVKTGLENVGESDETFRIGIKRTKRAD